MKDYTMEKLEKAKTLLFDFCVKHRDDEDEPMREVLAYVSSVIKMEKISLGKDEK